jgi:hypothetical protein
MPLPTFSAVLGAGCGSSKLIRSCEGFFGGGVGRGEVDASVSFVLLGSKVASRSLLIESTQSSTRRASSTRRVGVSRTELSEAPSLFLVLPEPLLGAAPVAFENMLRYQ